jgi:flagellar hook-length control protein FliK
MQGLSIAPSPAPAIPVSSASDASPGNSGSGAAAEGVAGSPFGNILAGQIKGKTAGSEGKVKAGGESDNGSDNGKADANLTPVTLAELLAAAGIVPAPVVPSQQLDAVKLSQSGGDAALVAMDNSAAGIGQLAVAKDSITAAGKLTATNDLAEKVDRFALKATNDAAEIADRLAVEGNDMRARGVEEFAGDGKLLSTLKQPADGVALQGDALDKSDRPARLEAASGDAGDLMASSTTPVAMPLTQVAGDFTPAGKPSSLEISAPVGSSSWGKELGDKVVWMSGQGNQVAELRLDPPHLGPLEVRLTMNNDQASAVVVSHHPAVREAIESAMPRLREMLADSGIMLGNTMVGAESFQQQQQAFAQNSSGGQSPRQGDGSGTDLVGMGGGGQSATATKMNRGLVDTFV